MFALLFNLFLLLLLFYMIYKVLFRKENILQQNFKVAVNNGITSLKKDALIGLLLKFLEFK